MRLLVLGASGGCGRWLTQLAAEHGHSVTAVVRSGSTAITHPQVTARIGDVGDPAFLDQVVPGHDAVLSCLGIRRAGKIPTARLLSPADFTARVTTLILAAMRRHGVRRIIVISAGGVGDSFARLSWLVQRVVSTSNLGRQYQDLGNMERVLAASDADWLAVRPVTLVNGKPRGLARPIEKYGLASNIRRSEVAEWMLEAVERSTPFIERTVLLGT
jgi:uncharacterized protein YbjT (DUF2867 family)